MVSTGEQATAAHLATLALLLHNSATALARGEEWGSTGTAKERGTRFELGFIFEQLDRAFKALASPREQG